MDLNSFVDNRNQKLLIDRHSSITRTSGMSQGYRSTDQTFKNSAILQGWRHWNGLTTAIQPTPTPPPFPTPMGTILSWFLMRSPTRDPWTNSLTETHAVPIYQHICAKLSKCWLREKSISSLRTEWSLFVRLESLSPKDALKLAHRFFKICQLMFFRYFVTTYMYLPLEKDVAFIWTNLNSLH